MKHSIPMTALLCGVLVACGGGGGGGDPPAAEPGANIALSGTAAKGRMAGADVAAYAANADGSVGTTALATATTGSDGSYTLNFPAIRNTPYVITVSAKSDGSTDHLDEVTGVRQALPAGFRMRALLVPTTTGNVTTSANVTPFSELAVAAAGRASGGITKANADQAISTVAQIFGFDPSTVAVKPAGAQGATENENKLAILLTAVSALADGNALGCGTGSAGDKTRCVVEALAAAASTTSIKLEAGSTNVSAALSGALSTVLADPALSGNVDPSTLAAITSNLACTSGCTAAPVATVAAIDSARSLFTAIRSDWQVLFSRGGVSAGAIGEANVEAWKFRQAMTGVQTPAATMITDLGALMLGADLYNDYKAGRTTSPTRGRAAGEVASNTAPQTQAFNAVGCTLYQDSATLVTATAPANANFIGCRASFYVTAAGIQTTDWGHGFTITPTANGGFTYTTRARQRVTCANQGCAATSTGLSAVYNGTLSTSTNGAGNVTSFTVSGELPPTFTLDQNTLADDHGSWAMAGTRTITGPNAETSSITGNVVSYRTATEVAGTLTLKTGTLTSIPVSLDAFGRPVKPGSPSAVATGGGEVGSGALDIVWATPSAEFEGVLTSAPSEWDASGTSRAPTAVTLSGALRNIAAGVTTEFLKGSLSLTITGFAAFNDTEPDSAVNSYGQAAQFTGTVTAPGRPTLELTMSASQRSNLNEATSVNLQYRSLVGGAPRTVIAVTGTRGANGDVTWTLSEATAGLSMGWTDGATRASLMKGSEVIGELDAGSKLLTFSDRSVMSLDIGL